MAPSDLSSPQASSDAALFICWSIGRSETLQRSGIWFAPSTYNAQRFTKSDIEATRSLGKRWRWFSITT